MQGHLTGTSLKMDITELLAFTAEQNASDLHLSAGLPPMIRVDGDVRRINVPPMDHAQVQGLITAEQALRAADSENDVRLAIKLDSTRSGRDSKRDLNVEAPDGRYVDKWWQDV